MKLLQTTLVITLAIMLVMSYSIADSYEVKKKPKHKPKPHPKPKPKPHPPPPPVTPPSPPPPTTPPPNPTPNPEPEPQPIEGHSTCYGHVLITNKTDIRGKCVIYDNIPPIFEDILIMNKKKLICIEATDAVGVNTVFIDGIELPFWEGSNSWYCGDLDDAGGKQILEMVDLAGNLTTMAL